MTKTSHKPKRLVLLDAHAILHRAYHALPDFASTKGEPTGALYGLSTMLIKLIADLKPDHLVACYDLPGPTFRHEAYAQYKAKRPKADSALVAQMKRSRDIFTAFSIPVYEHSGFEADDIIGTIVENMKKELAAGTIEIIIASGDMDTLQLVDGENVRVYTLKKGLNDTILYNEKAVENRFGFSPELLPDYKGLRGDPSDNIIGIVGIGEKTATQLVREFGTIENMYATVANDSGAFEKKGLTKRVAQILKDGEEEALFSKTLATIRRDAPIAFMLPKATWQEEVSFGVIEKLFSELSFRALADRVRKIVSAPQVSAVEEKGELPSEDEIERLSIALWLVDSNITNPQSGDIAQYGDGSLVRARERLEKEITELGLKKVYEEIELPLIPILGAARARGVALDRAYLAILSERYHKEINIIRDNIYKAAGIEFNINSPKQLGEVLFDRLALSAKGLKKTDGGARSTKESELIKLKEAHPITGFILEYREIQKLLSTYIDNLPALADKNSRLHTTLVQSGTTTGRMSSMNPNLQNIPVAGERGKEIRRAFVAADGHVLCAFDYSQIELRVLAHLSDDAALVRIFNEGKDAHTSVASEVYDVPETEVTKDMRRHAKVINFGIIYGMGVSSLQKALGGTRADAQKFYDRYFQEFPSVAKFLDNIRATAARDGFTLTAFGRRRRIDGLRSNIPYIRAEAERMALNAPIQGTAADIIKIAMRKVDEGLREKKLRESVHLVLQVHDELIYEVEDGAQEKAIALVRERMERAAILRVPLTVTAVAGKNWGALK